MLHYTKERYFISIISPNFNQNVLIAFVVSPVFIHLKL
ncbi:hypothetical protein PHEL49_0762 [Polaribacter sp. Hel1_33_49]|nr:hypothetical protein PHEL49_0762 [Polaribacter sp. Hel1_33_49]